MNGTGRVYYDVRLQPITNATKIKIIEASIELFSREGFSGASIRDITREVGIKESSLYKHFSNKDEILETVFQNFRIETEKILPPMQYIDRIAETMSPAAFLEKGIENFLEHINDTVNQKTWRILYTELFRHPMAKEIYRSGIMERTVGCLETVFERMIRLGRMSPVNPRVFATEYQSASIALILEYNMLKNDGQSTEALELRIREHVRFFAAMAEVGSDHNGEGEGGGAVDQKA